MSEEVDKLECLFELQKDFQKRIHGIELPQCSPEHIPMTVTSIIAELGEILEEDQRWKDWKENPDFPDLTELGFEVVDLWHFIINLSLYLGFSATDIYQMFVKKNEINHERQNNDY